MFHVSPEAKERVLKKREHQMVIDGKPVTIFLETTKKPVKDPRPSPPSLTQPDEAPSSSPPSLTQPAEAPSSSSTSVTRSLDEALADEGPVYNSDDAIFQKVSVELKAGTDATTAPRAPLLPFWSSSLSCELGAALGTGLQR